ncbi:septal ring lytic transglycosylase RlpA family protein [Rhodocytophaga aerolata]|uniref:Probable endolytic peptidoglycan transglycosylase RlpA n=1 Tax=Rhodocytophaga aerolata TaxID=455078 RepID=A0ABT8R7F1_9BACT|nr:septal ring lytic transglycosylase RlpA family protein [Rhodocytophaga aerolata]MDO1448035.1 septal ring lytic transglycosylase RlpA family protein [Rhodocytophaga aerolata]
MNEVKNVPSIKILIQALVLLLVLGLFSCKTASSPPSKEKAKLRTETGMASFYANKHNGKKTASGERYQSSKLTAAHKTLPFGTMVKVTNLSNGKTVEVRINDRGPFARGRIIDLSRSAAKQIDMINAGVTKVKLEYRK